MRPGFRLRALPRSGAPGDSLYAGSARHSNSATGGEAALRPIEKAARGIDDAGVGMLRRFAPPQLPYCAGSTSDSTNWVCELGTRPKRLTEILVNTTVICGDAAWNGTLTLADSRSHRNGHASATPESGLLLIENIACGKPLTGNRELLARWRVQFCKFRRCDALQQTRHAHVAPEAGRMSVRTRTGLGHRMQFVGLKHGKRFADGSRSAGGRLNGKDGVKAVPESGGRR